MDDQYGKTSVLAPLHIRLYKCRKDQPIFKLNVLECGRQLFSIIRMQS